MQTARFYSPRYGTDDLREEGARMLLVSCKNLAWEFVPVSSRLSQKLLIGRLLAHVLKTCQLLRCAQESNDDSYAKLAMHVKNGAT